MKRYEVGAHIVSEHFVRFCVGLCQRNVIYTIIVDDAVQHDNQTSRTAAGLSHLIWVNCAKLCYLFFVGFFGCSFFHF